MWIINVSQINISKYQKLWSKGYNSLKLYIYIVSFMPDSNKFDNF